MGGSAGGESEPLLIRQNAILKDLHFIHDVRDSVEQIQRSLDNRVRIESEMFNGAALESGIGNDASVSAHQPETDRNEADKRCFYRGY